MIDVKRISLTEARTDLFLTQEDLADKAELSLSTINRCERQGTLRLINAKKILGALNEVRQAKNLPDLDMNDLDWQVQGLK